MTRNQLRKFTVGLVVVIGLSLFTAVTWADSDVNFKQLANDRAGGLVTVKYILAVSMGGARGNMEQESEIEMTCVMATAEGMVMCSNNQLTGFVEMIKQFAGAAGREISAVPKDIRIIAGPESKSFDAEIVARDSELDIAWIKIKNADDIQFDHIDFKAGKAADIGDEFVILRRMGNHFGRAIVISEGKIGGITSKPRTLYIPAAAYSLGGGLPVFTPSGDVIGLMISQLPDSDGNSPQMMVMIGGNLQDAVSGLILPAEEVVRATARAMTPRL